METEWDREGEQETRDNGQKGETASTAVSQDPGLRTQCPGLDTRANHAVGSMDNSGPGRGIEARC